MRLVLVAVAAGLFAGCLSAARERELQCLGTLLQDVWDSKEQVALLEADWRAHRRRGSGSRIHAGLVSDRFATEPAAAPAPRSFLLTDAGEDEVLSERLADARRSHRSTMAWYDRVAKRVQTCFEEDDTLSPVRARS